MTALSLHIHARPAGWRGWRARLAPFWPALVLAILIWGATCCTGADTEWLGRSREEVVAALGKPLSAMQRGDTEVLMYPDSVKIEIRNDAVVSYRAGSGPTIVASDGTRYTPTDRGKVQRIVEKEKTEDEIAAEEDAAAAAALARNEAAADAAASVNEDPFAEEAVADDADAGDRDEWTRVATSNGGADAVDPDAQMLKIAETYAETGKFTDKDIEEPPPWQSAVLAAIGGLVRFGITLLVLRVAINWVGLPCYMPDVIKVAALFVILREGVYGLGGLGGHWEWLRLFRAADVIGFFALCGLLYQFKVALTGITALKIAVTTWLVTYFGTMLLMIAVMFGLGTMF